jgi:small neutral amino acid transporter SnatA (MarC family)
MSIITPIPPQLPLYQRLFFNIPVLGWMARDVIYGDRDNIVWAGVILAAIWLWGVTQLGVLLLLATFTAATGLLIAGGFYVWFSVQVSRAEARAARAKSSGKS